MCVREGCCTCYLKLGWGAQWKWVAGPEPDRLCELHTDMFCIGCDADEASTFGRE